MRAIRDVRALRTRGVLIAVADQIVSSGTNYATAFVASLVLEPAEFGAFVVAYAVVVLAVAVSRATVGEPMLAVLPTVDTDRRQTLGTTALGAAAVLGVVLAAGIGVLCVVGDLTAGGGPTLHALAVLAPWLPVAMLADTGRYRLIADRRWGGALTADLAGGLVQGLVLAGLALSGTLSVGALAAAWGVGALVVLAVLSRSGVGRPSGPRPWLRQARSLAGWFTGVSVLGQAQVYLVVLLAGLLLSDDDVAGLRAVQLMVFQPAATLAAAMLTFLTPVLARQVAAGDGVGLRHTEVLAVAGVGLLGLAVLAAIPLRGELLSWFFPRFTDRAALVAPIAIQTVLSVLVTPVHARMRAQHRGAALFVIHVAATVLLVSGALVGLLLGGVLGLAWGVAASTAAVLGVWAAGNRRAASPPAADALTPGSVPYSVPGGVR